MAHIWVKDESENWAVLRLAADAYTVASNPPRPIQAQLTVDDAASKEPLVLLRENGSGSWVLIAAPGFEVRVNGAAVPLGIRVLADRDEISTDEGGAIYFSTENLARVEPFPGAQNRLFCPRCKQAVETDHPAVRCPQCGVWYHQTDELPCWTYAQHCALCDQSTQLSAGYRWTPEEL